jgi:WhiB family redox-sensing transcriptional regulator
MGRPGDAVEPPEAHGRPRRRPQQESPKRKRDAECRSSDPNVFFPERGDSDTLEVARSICRTCSVAEECLAYALTLPPQDAGVYAGRSAKKLQPMRRGWRAARRAAGGAEVPG